MKQIKQTAIVFAIAAILLSAAGCDEAYAQKKRAMVSQWEKATAQAKLPVVEDMIKRGELEKAKETLNKCLAADPENSRVHLLVGRVHFIEGRTDKALQAFRKAVELDPELAEGWHQLGALAIMDKDYMLALADSNKALELQPANTQYRISVCALYVEMQQADRARELIEEGLSKQPDSLELMLELAQLYHQSGEMERAVKIYEQAQLIHGNQPRILEPCGYAYMALGKWDKAAEKFELLLSLLKEEQDHYDITLRSLATCSFNAENFGRALTCYDELSVVYRDDADVWMGMAQSALGLDDTVRAVNCAKKALQLQPGWPKAQAVLGCALYMNGDYENAAAAFSKITENEEFAAFAWFMTGRCCRQLGRTVQAETAFRRAEQLDPDNELIRMYLKKTLKFL